MLLACGHEGVAVASHRVGVFPGLPVLELGGGSLGDQGTQGLLIGIADEMVKLVVNDAEFLLDLFQAR